MLTTNRSSAIPALDLFALQPTAEELWDAWAFAAVEAQLALAAWLEAPVEAKGDAFSSYRAALDREEQAATLLAARKAAA